MTSAAVYPIRAGVVQEMPPNYPGTIQPCWQLGYPDRATPTSDIGMTNAGSAVTTAAAKVGFVATEASPRPVDVPASGRIILPVNGHNWLFLKPIFKAANNANLPLAVWSWRALDNKSNNNPLDVMEWIVDPIVHVTAVACAAVGVSGGRIGPLWRYCDTFSSEVYRGLATTGFLTSEHPSAADDAPAYMIFDIAGAQYIEVEGVINAETAWNFLWFML